MRNNSFWIGMFLGGIVGATAILTKKMLINCDHELKIDTGQSEGQQNQVEQFDDLTNKVKVEKNDVEESDQDKDNISNKIDFSQKIIELEETLNKLKEDAGK